MMKKQLPTSGWSAHQIMNRIYTYAYDDLILLPGYIDFPVHEVSLQCQLTPHITLQTPIISSPMDTVTESEMAISIALHGGLGIIHANLSMEKQVEEIRKVKRFQNGFITNPVVVSPHTTVGEIIALQNKHRFTGFPVTTDGGQHSKIIGIVSRRDIDLITDEQTLVQDVMTTTVITANQTVPLSQANHLLRQHKVSRLPIVDDQNHLMSLVCRKDLRYKHQFPLATKNSQTNQLQVGAAVSTHLNDRERIDALAKAGVDLIVIDSSQGNSCYQLETCQYIREKYPHIDLMGGNVVITEQAHNLIQAGVHSLRVGMGIGSICTTQEVCGIGRGQASAVYHVSNYSSKQSRPDGWSVTVVADGGIANSGHIIKALSLGASAVMLGSMMAGTDESPGEYYYKDGMRLKKYRGMGSLESMKLGSDSRYHSGSVLKSKTIVQQGVVGEVSSKGSIQRFIPYLVQSIKHGFQNLGEKNIESIHQSLDTGRIRMETRTVSAQREGDVHHLYSFENN